jgi:hypothetical protein
MRVQLTERDRPIHQLKAEEWKVVSRSGLRTVPEKSKEHWFGMEGPIRILSISKILAVSGRYQSISRRNRCSSICDISGEIVGICSTIMSITLLGF